MLDVFSSSGVAETLLMELSTLVTFLETPRSSSGAGKFGALELTGLRALAEAYGRASEQYEVAASTVRGTLESALAQTDMRVALVTFSPSASGLKRDSQPPPQSPIPAPSHAPAPIGSDKVCFTSAEACGNATSACSGHGQCVPGTRVGRQCYVCSCGATKEGLKTTQWAGATCERKDVSGYELPVNHAVSHADIAIVQAVRANHRHRGHAVPSRGRLYRAVVQCRQRGAPRDAHG
jgi:hypothetical protein